MATDRRRRDQLSESWHATTHGNLRAKLLLDGADAEALTTQIELALLLDGHRRF